MSSRIKANRAIIVCGSPGAGKTTYGKKLAKELRACLIDIDTCTEGLVRTGLDLSGHDPNDRDSEYFKSSYREVIYETLFSIARENLPFTDVVVVGPFTREIRDSTWPAKLGVRLETPVEVHYVYCSPECRRERIKQRGEGRDLAKLADWDASRQYFGAEDRPEFTHTFIDTSAC
jgi:predicted kinase